MHTSVLLQQAVDALNIRKDGRYIDATYGLGGHSKEIAARGGKVLGIDWDAASIEHNVQKSTDDAVQVIQGNFADIAEIARIYDFFPVHGVLFDLGLSMWHMRSSGRGFSYENDKELLDMRLSSSLKTTAADIINSYSVEDLYEIFTKNAEEINSRAIVSAIDEFRRMKRIQSVGELKNVIRSVTKDPGSVSRIFQALRIEVNNEFENIRKGLAGALSILESGGRIAIIAFHPSEDRIIKSFIRENNLKTEKKPILGKKGQRFERSAVLRVIHHTI